MYVNITSQKVLIFKIPFCSHSFSSSLHCHSTPLPTLSLLFTSLLLLYLQLPGSKSAKLVVQFTGRHTKTHEALLLLVGELGVGVRGETISFALKGDISGTLPLVRDLKCFIVYKM